ncbi:MAG: hypothetical protein QOG85_1841 [Gaiellaceae bacterium]|nr:hypothetical protein [Gaiellaceae bacterium]
MRRLLLLALVAPAISACGWSPFPVSSGPTPPVFHACGINTPSGPMPCGPSAPHGALVVSGGGALSDNAHDSYVAWGTSLVSANEGRVEIPLPGVFSVTDLQVRITTAPGGGSSWTLTVDKDGSATALTCSINGAATTCSDASLFAVAVGDLIDLHVTPIGSPRIARISWSAKLVPRHS